MWSHCSWVLSSSGQTSCQSLLGSFLSLLPRAGIIGAHHQRALLYVVLGTQRQVFMFMWPDLDGLSHLSSCVRLRMELVDRLTGSDWRDFCAFLLPPPSSLLPHYGLKPGAKANGSLFSFSDRKLTCWPHSSHTHGSVLLDGRDNIPLVYISQRWSV